MSERSWKRAERKVAELLGGVRVPVSGRQRGHTPDVEHPSLSIEVKSRKSLPAWLLDALEQAQAASRNGRLPVAVLHQEHRLYADSLCVLRLEDLACLLKVPPGEEREDQEPVTGDPPGLTPQHWERAQDGLCRLRREVEVLDHPLITVRLLPPLEAALGEASRYRDACLEEEASSG